MKIVLNQPYSFQQIGKRDNQEDARFPDENIPKRYAPFFVVCDGVGGEEKGEVASGGVCWAFWKALSDIDWNADFSDESFQVALDAAYRNLNNLSHPGNAGMATTMTFVAFHGEGAFIAHIGDSRVYHVRPGDGILYRSEDHSLVNALVHSGNITPEEAIHHPDRNVITRYIGITNEGQERFKATVWRVTDIQAGDYFFLCTDGVLSCVSDQKLVEILSENIPDKDKMERIARMSADSDDNNTAYLIPIASVQGRPEVRTEEMPVAEDNKTTSFPKKSEQVRDVVSTPASESRNTFCRFIKKLFNR